MDEKRFLEVRRGKCREVYFRCGETIEGKTRRDWLIIVTEIIPFNSSFCHVVMGVPLIAADGRLATTAVHARLVRTLK